MPYFKDEAEVYAFIGRLFQELVKDDELAPKFQKANTIVQYQYREPESQITVKMIEDEEPQVDLGPTELEPEVVMTMEADTAHKFWLGRRERDRGAGPRADAREGTRGQDPQARAAREARVPALPEDPRGSR